MVLRDRVHEVVHRARVSVELLRELHELAVAQLEHEIDFVNRELEHLPPITVYEPTYVERPPEVDTSEPLNIIHEEDTWIVEGPWLQRLMANTNFGDFESRSWFDKMLRQSGLYDRLEEMGVQDGDTVSLYNLEFEYQR